MATKFAVVQQAAPATNTTQDFTSSGFGTPTAVIFLISGATASDGTEAGHARLSIGWSDFTRTRCSAIAAEDAVGPTDTYRHGASDKIGAILNLTGGIDRDAKSPTAITDGVRVTWAGSTTQYQACAVLIQADNEYVGDWSQDDVTTTAVTDPGFTPTGLLVNTTGVGFGQTTNTSGITVFSVGGASNESTIAEAAGVWANNDGMGAVECVGRMDQTVVGINHRAGSPWNPSRSVRIASFDANGFTGDPEDVNDAFNNTYGYLALDVGAGFAVEEVDSATATGTQDITTDDDGGSFSPDFAMFILGKFTGWTNTNTASPSNGLAESFAIGVTDGTTSVCMGVRDDDAASTSAAKSYCNVSPVYVRDPGGVVADADFSQWNAGGVQIDWQTAPGTALKMIVIAAEEDVAGATSQSANVTFTFSPVSGRQIFTGKSAALSLSPSVAKTAFKSLSDTLRFAGTLAKTVFKSLSDTLRFVAAQAESFISGGATLKEIDAALSFAPAASKTVFKGVAGSFRLLAGMAKSMFETVAASLGLSPALVKSVAKTAGASLSLTGSLGKAVFKGISATLGLVGRTFIPYFQAVVRFTAAVATSVSRFVPPTGFTGHGGLGVGDGRGRWRRRATTWRRRR